MVSDTHLLEGEKEEKLRFNILSATDPLCEESVVGLFLHEYLLFNPIGLIYFTTVGNDTSVPLLQSSPLIQGLP